MKYPIVLTLALCFVQGQALEITGEGMGISPQEAIEKAKQDALAKGIGQQLTAQTEVQDYMVRKDIIVTSTMGVIKDYREISRAQDASGAWTVRISADVAEGALRSDLFRMKILRESIDHPRIAFLIKEKLPQTGSSNNLEVKLVKAFRDWGLDVVDPNLVLRLKEGPDATKAWAGDPLAAAQLGSKVNADVLIVAEVKAVENDLSQNTYLAGSSMRSVTANATLKAYQVDSRRLLAAGEASGTRMHPSLLSASTEAVSQMGQTLMDQDEQFFDQLITAWQDEANNGKYLEIEVSGIADFNQAKLVSQALQKTHTEPFKETGFEAGSLSGSMRFLGRALDYCSKLEGQAIAGKTIKIIACKGNQVQAQIQ